MVGMDGLIAAAEARRMLAIQLGVGPEAKDPQTRPLGLVDQLSKFRGGKGLREPMDARSARIGA